MIAYQEKYIQNTKEIASLIDVYSIPLADFSSWYGKIRSSRKRVDELKKENIALLNEHFFPTLDNLYTATEKEISDLEEFGDQLMDWTSNLDVGVYVMIHDALLSMYRYRKDLNRVIKELYKLGIGMYYQNRMILGAEGEEANAFAFESEMVFTEGASYLKYFEEIDDMETRGYIVRCLANVSIATTDRKRKIRAISHAIRIIKDDYYRNLAPDLPWDTYLRRAYQQMSSTRSTLSRGDLSTEELSEILEACQIVFEPEKDQENPDVRWLWPYYEMEYNCGFVDIHTTLDRMERLILETPLTRDASGMYAYVQLPIYYGRLLRNNPNLPLRAKRLVFLRKAYDRMMDFVLTYPQELFDAFFYYDIALLTTDYYETEGMVPYKDIALSLLRRFKGLLYIDLQKTSAIVMIIADYIFRHDPSFFDDIPFLREMKDPLAKQQKLAEYAADCGIFYDFGLLKMTMERIQMTRIFFEREYEMYQIHARSGYDDLRLRPSTRIYADVALGHHAWYNGKGGYPKSYERTKSDYRPMTDIVALVLALISRYEGKIEKAVEKLLEEEGLAFSPLVCAYLRDKDLQEAITTVLDEDDEAYYRMFYEVLRKSEDAKSAIIKTDKEDTTDHE